MSKSELLAAFYVFHSKVRLCDYDGPSAVFRIRQSRDDFTDLLTKEGFASPAKSIIDHANSLVFVKPNLPPQKAFEEEKEELLEDFDKASDLIKSL